MKNTYIVIAFFLMFFLSFNLKAEEFKQVIVPDDVNTKVLGEESVGAIINFQGTNLDERKYVGGNMEDKVENSATQVVGEGFGRHKEYPLSLNDQLLDKANYVMEKPEQYVDWIKGEAVDCKEEEVKEIKERFICNEYEEMKQASCIIGQRIEVDAKHQYECLKSLDKFKKVCDKKLNIERKHNCPNGIINWIQVENIRNNNSKLEIDTSFGAEVINNKGIYYYDKDIILEVKDIEAIEAFTIEHIKYGFPVTIRVNGEIVFADTNGLEEKVSLVPYDLYWKNYIHNRDKPQNYQDKYNRKYSRYYDINKSNEGTHVVYYAGTNKYMHVSDIALSPLIEKEVKVNLRPYLKEGRNVIHITTIRWGMTTLIIEAKYNCIAQRWQEVCKEEKV